MFRLTFSIILLIAPALAFSSPRANNYTTTDTTELNPRIGAYIGGGMNLHHGDFELPTAKSCCQGYTFGTGITPIIGAFIDYPYDYKWMGSIRFGYENMAGDFKEREEVPVIVNNELINGAFQNRLNTDFHVISIEPAVSYRLMNHLWGRAGLKTNVLLSSHYNQGEYIIEPSDRGGFPDNKGKSFRNLSDGKINNSTSITLGIQAGLGYELPMNKRRWLWLIPEIKYAFMFIPPVNGTNWFTHTFRASAGIAYRKPNELPPPPPPPAYPPIAELPAPMAPPKLHASVDVALIDSTGKEADEFKIVIEDFITLNMRPLLNYIFFDENSAVIPERYKKLDRNTAKEFKMTMLNEQNALETYYNALNIVGLRLKQRPQATITITGANSNTGAEKNNIELSKSRAEAVKSYLTTVWEIEENRMKIESRNLPKEASRSDYPEGQDENRRVEIVSKDWNLTEPVITIDTMRVLNNTHLRFKNYASSESGIRKWRLKAVQRNATLLDTSGVGELPLSIDWQIGKDGKNTPQKASNVFYQLEIEDDLGQQFITNPEQMPVEQITVERKRMEMQQDKEYEYYSLILFNYGSSNLDKEHKEVVDFVKNRATDEAKIFIYGHTDNLGDEEINKKISEKRAKAVAERLDIPSAKVEGKGEEELLYDNKNPEARFYCRTVRISIETPIKD